MQIIAEVGSNWWVPDSKPESLKLAIQSIWEARWAKADIVKFQMFRANTLYSDQRSHLKPDELERLARIRTDIRKFELPPDFIPPLKHECAQAGIKLWISFFDLELLERYAKDVDGIKIASGDLDFYDLVDMAGRLASSYAKDVCVSTGAATWDEIEIAVRTLASNRKPIVLHCISAYPAPPDKMNIRTISELAKLPKIQAVGLSDHSLDNLPAQLALAQGATYFEKHFRPTGAHVLSPDYNHSLDKFGFRGYVRLIENAAEILGTGKISPEYSPDGIESGERIWARRGPDDRRPR